jgi:type I restriction enzyme S subunit
MSEFPSGWATKTIQETCDIHDSRRIPLSSEQRRDRKGRYPYYGANNIQDYIDDFIFDFDAVLLAEDGGNYEEYESRDIAQYATNKYWVNNHAHILTGKSGMDTKFLYYSLVRKNICQWINTGTRSKLNQADLKQIELLVPPLPEQKKIAEILSGIDYLLKAKKAKVKKTRLLLKYTIEDATSRSATGETVPLKELGEWKGGGTPSKSVSEYWNGEIPWVSPKDMKEQRVSTSQEKITEAAIENSATSLVPRGSILFVVRSGILRHTFPMALAARDVAINQDLKALTVNDRCNANFLFHYLSSKSDEILASCMKSGTTVESIDTNSLQNYEVPTLSPKTQEQLSLFAEGITRTCEEEESQVESLNMS